MTDKPGSVENNHSSRTSIATCLKQPTQEPREPRVFADKLFLYLVLLRVGFTLPRLLPTARCALTAPFHPYPIKKLGGIFSVALSISSHFPDAIWHPALWSPDFPHLHQQAESAIV